MQFSLRKSDDKASKNTDRLRQQRAWSCGGRWVVAPEEAETAISSQHPRVQMGNPESLEFSNSSQELTSGSL